MGTGEKVNPYILGLDLGAESIGWAVLACEGNRPTSIAAAGAHCFDAGRVAGQGSA